MNAATWNTKPLQALTLMQPWAYAVATGLMLVENRHWTPSPKHLQPGDDLVIHAGVRQGGVGSTWIDMRSRARAAGTISRVPTFEQMHGLLAFGAVVAVARFDGVVHWSDELAPEQRPWWVGRYGWKLSNVRQLQQPIECRGRQELWPLGPIESERLTRVLRSDERHGLWRRTAA